MTAASLDNTGGIRLLGSSANQALLDVAGSAGFGTAGVLSGHVRLTGDSAIEFASGQITSLADGALLRLNGNDAFIEDSTALGSNSALRGLASIGGFEAMLNLENGASVSTTGSLINHGDIEIDVDRGGGGSSLTLAGALTNSWSLQIGNAALSASDKVTAASLDNANTISLTGSGANQALLDVTAGSAGFGVAGVLSGEVTLTGASAIEFASGQITSLAAGAILGLNGGNAFIEDSTAPGSNSALKGLALIGAGSIFGLENGAAVSTTGALVNDGNVSIDAGGSSLTVGGTLTNTGALRMGGSGSSLTVGGTLTNTGALRMGGSAGLFLSSSKVSTTALTNTGLISLTGTDAAPALLDVSGATTNNGSILVFIGTEELAGAVGGAGSFGLFGSNLQFDFERFGRADHHRASWRERAYARARAGLSRHDQRFRDRRHDRRDELCRDCDVVQFPREFAGDRRHAHAHRRESDRQYPDDRRLFEQEFHPRPRQRDRHAGEVRLSA